MKQKLFVCILAGFLVLGSIGYAFADVIEAESRISQVTVFSDSALLTRSGAVSLVPGEHQVVFADIIPDIDENSLRVAGSGGAGFKILGAQLKKEFLKEESSAKVKELNQKIEEIEIEKRRLTDEHNVAMQEREYLTSLIKFSGRQLPKDMATKFPSSKDLGDVLSFLDTNLKANYKTTAEIELKFRELDKRLDVLKRELAEISGSQKLKRSIVADIQAQKAGSLNLSISYLVRGASWRPIYEARAAFEKGGVELILSGAVRQTTGEDWPDVELTLSTAKPSISGRMPEIIPWFLRPFQPRQKLASAEYEPYYMETNFQVGAAKDESVAYQKEMKRAEAPMSAEMAYAVSEERGVSVIYKVPRKATLKSDGSEQRLPIASQELVAKFKYSAYPKGSLFAYLSSRVTNAKTLQLLSGQVNIFLDGEFVGTSFIDNIAPGEEFDLSLGIDENVKVKKELIEKKVDDVLLGGIPSPNRRETYKYKLTAENYKNKKIDFELFEAMPTSEDERIKVKINQVSLEPKDKDFKDKKGVWRWELQLEPQGKKEIFYSFTVECPRGMRVEGL